MDVIGQNIAKLVEERLKEALRERDIKIQALEEDKRRLTRLASDMKNDVKHMKITIDMYEKTMVKNKLIHKCNKAVQCDRFRGLPPQHNHSETNSSTSLSPKSENCESPNDLNGREAPQRCNNENEIGPTNHSSSSSSLICPERAQITSPMSLGEMLDQQQSSNDDPMGSRPPVSSAQPTLANVRKRNPRNNVEIIDLSDEENNNDKYDKNDPTGGLNNDNRDQVNFSAPRIKKEFIAPKIEIMPGSTKLEKDGKHSTVFVITHDSENLDPETRNVDHYEVYMLYRKPGNAFPRDEKRIGTVQPSFPSTAIHFNANHLQSGVEYRFRVKPVDAQDQLMGRVSEDCVFFVPTTNS